MKVLCKINDLVDVNTPVAVRLDRYVYGPGPDYGLELDAEYFVYAIELMRGGIWIYIETQGRDYPFPYPIEFFEIVDSNIPDDWQIATPYRGVSKAIISFKEWASNPDFYEKLIDGSFAEARIYELQKQ